jgi:hypothetical protein
MFRRRGCVAGITGLLETRNWRRKLLYKRGLNMYNEVAYRKISRCCNKDQIRI